jgi:hypothetical protein
MAALFGRRRDGDVPLRWSIVVASPKGEAGAQWGDTWFATDLVEALNRAGQDAQVVFRNGANAEARENDDVVLVLRGLRRVVPRRGGALWLLWIISHPELVEVDEPSQYDAVFAASEHWRRGESDEFGVTVTPLLQASNPRRFNPSAAPADSGEPVLFVGSTRGEFRPAVRDALAGGIDVSVYGVGWEAFLEPGQIRGEFLANDRLPAAYASAGVVLNDHWSDMAAEGFLSNRLFDAAACGSRVLSDPAVGLAEVFGPDVRTFATGDELVAALSVDPDEAFPSRQQRLDLAGRIARDHGFDARAAVLIQRARELKDAR